MNASGLKLKNVPIVEAVLDIDCDLPPDQPFASLEGPARDSFRDRYPTFRTQLVQEHQIETKPDQPVTLSFRQSVLTNRMFKNTLTESCLSLFRQP